MEQLPKKINPIDVPIVSFDIINHGISPLDEQIKRISSLHKIIGDLIHIYGESQIIWVSGGDGGHVAIALKDWSVAIIKLLIDLRRWEKTEDAEIRITCHFGSVVCIIGVDGHQQLVGDGINFCGSLVNFGHSYGVVASSAFMKEFKLVTAELVNFKDPRIVYLKHSVAERVYILSISKYPELDGEWGGDHLPEEILLENASASKDSDPWTVIYRAKRLLQVHTGHRKVESELNSLDQTHLFYKDVQDNNKIKVNPLFRSMTKNSFVKIIRKSQLVEREDGDILCLEGDQGDTMCIILQGKIGISKSCVNSSSNDEKPFSIVLDKGSIVGELAYHLHRERTATMHVIGKTALLMLEPESIKTQMKQSEVLRFLNSRALEHLCNYTDLGATLKESDRKDPWFFLEDTTVKSFSWDSGPFFEFTDSRFKSEGLYLLASGRIYLDDGLEKPPEWSKLSCINKLRILSAEMFPVLFVNIPDYVASPPNCYYIDSSSKVIKVIHIPLSNLKENFSVVFDKLVDFIRNGLDIHFIYDVFISFNHNDKEFSHRLRKVLCDKKLNVYMNEADPGKAFKSEIQAALRQSRVMVAVISANVRDEQGEKSWVEREVRYRQSIFNPNSANILPLRRGSERKHHIVGDISSIYSHNREPEAFQDVLSFVNQVKERDKPLPFSKSLNLEIREI